MQPGDRIATRVFVSFLIVLFLEPLLTLGRQCELSATYGSTHYNYSLAAPSQKYPHGVMSEDGRRKVCALRLFGWCCAFLGDAKDWTHFSVRIWFYKVAVNETILWYQLCDQMIFNHGQPRCLNCQDCGGPSRCGMQCSALTANVIGGYHVCTTIGQGSNLNVSLIEKNNPQKGVIVMMVANNLKENCSLSVSVICDSNKVQVSNSLTISGECDYATELWHPSGCPRIISAKAKGWEWFGTLIIILLCFLGAYLLVGTSYRCFFLGIHGIQAIPNLQFWFNLSQRIRVVLVSLARTLKRFFCGRRASYTPLRNAGGFYAATSY